MADADKYPHLLHSNHLGGHRAVRALGNRILATWLTGAAERVAKQPIIPVSVGVVINARTPRYPRSLAHNRNDPGMMLHRINRTLDGIDGQAYPRKLVRQPLVLYDEGMSIPLKYRKPLEERARLIPLPCTENHSVAFNTGIGIARSRNPRIIALLDAGSHYATDQAFRAMADAVDRDYAAAFGPHLADRHASVTQSLWRNIRAITAFTDRSDPYILRHHIPGFIPADGTAYSTDRLPHLPFDETFGRGGGNNNFIRNPENEVTTRFDPALSVQSGEWNLGPLALLAVAMERSRVENPTEYNIQPTVSKL